MKAVIKFLKKETVFSIAIIMAVVSAFFVPPSAKYIDYLDFKVLTLLFNLMLIVAGIKEQWIFRRIAEKLTLNAKSSKPLELILVLLPFFSSMVITNDVALITFVPFALALLNGVGLQKRIIRTLVLQTIAANLGSMLTPIGNPQNLYLYTKSGMSMGDFFLLMLPLSLVALAALIIVVLVGKKEEIKLSFDKPNYEIDKKKLIILAVLFVICLGTVFRLSFDPWYISFGIVLVVGLVFFRNLFKEVDYFLLGTFIGFFIFIGNMQQIPAVTKVIENLLSGQEMVVSFGMSQVISNVPAAMLLSGFTDNTKALLMGVNIGGLGTLIASLASLISYKFYAVTEDSKKGKYLLIFTAWNVLFIVIMFVAYWLLNDVF